LKTILILAQNFANDAVKAGGEYAQEGLEQGQKLGEKAFELGKDKGKIYIYFSSRKLFFFFLFSE
jgi:hypothetical protein